MVLTYINPLNKNYKGEFIYEFIFSDNEEIDYGDDWDVTPAASGTQTPPSISEIKSIGIVKNAEVELDLALNSDTFSMYDCVEKIIALGWEKESPDDEIRLVFQFGESLDSVKDKLYSRDIIMEFIKN